MAKLKGGRQPRGGRRGSDRMVVGFLITYTVSVYHH